MDSYKEPCALSSPPSGSHPETMALQQPSEDECRRYYYGLPSQPRLVARSSTTHWYQPHEWSERKKLDVATGHRIQRAWNDPQGQLQPLIFDALGDMDWTAIDILRIGYEDAFLHPDRTSECPVTILVSVSEGSTSFQQAESAIIACKQVLALFNLDDVEVELKESIVTMSASTPDQSPATSSSTAGEQGLRLDPGPRLSPGPFTGDIDHIKYDFTNHMSEYVGTSIGAAVAPSPRKEKDGTKGFYLQSDDGKTYALTCRHAVFFDHEREVYRHEDATTTSKEVIQPGTNTLISTVRKFNAANSANNESIELTLKPFYNTSKWQDERSVFLQKQSLYRSCQPHIDQLENGVSAVLGRVEFSPPIELYSGRIRDWALVELSQDSFTTNLIELRNKIPVTQELRTAVCRIDGAKTRSGMSLRFDTDLEVVIGPRIIPESDLEDTSPRNIHGDRGLVVMKHGKTTKHTIGLGSGIQSVIRRPFEDGEDMISREWCVIGLDGAFSARGDSGACVCDLEGRIGGMLTGGLKSRDNPNSGNDVTYVTPMQWLMDDIKRHGYDVKLPE
ncbi:hypothetical protein IL306_004259 [Fusarium sp. DS 682]|nr:hypothetical protein IL306_004259 [Fusarium sp. DS 682]